MDDNPHKEHMTPEMIAFWTEKNGDDFDESDEYKEEE